MEEIIIKQISKEQIEELKIGDWPIWTKEISEFGWEYDDSTEECFIIEGELIITIKNNIYTIKVGDFVQFSPRLKCRWKIIQPIKKHYNFKP